MTKKELEDLVIQAQADGRPSDRLVEVVGQMATGIAERKGLHVDYDDARQLAYLTLIRVLPKLRTDKGSLFCYLTTCLLNDLITLWRADRRYERACVAAAERDGYRVGPDGELIEDRRRG